MGDQVWDGVVGVPHRRHEEGHHSTGEDDNNDDIEDDDVEYGDSNGGVVLMAKIMPMMMLNVTLQ